MKPRSMFSAPLRSRLCSDFFGVSDFGAATVRERWYTNFRNLALTVLLAGTLAFAQEPHAPAGGAVDTHAEATAKHGEGHETQPMPNEIWWKWANFAVLAVLLGWLIRKHAGPFFAARSEAIQAGIAEASKVGADAEARAAEIERRVNNLSAEVESLRERSREEIAREGERVRAETEASVRKIQAQAEAEIQSATKHAAHELKAYSAQLALDLAERQIHDRMTASAQEQIADAFVADLRGKATQN